jgi:hypothetical protein
MKYWSVILFIAVFAACKKGKGDFTLKGVITPLFAPAI